MKCLLVQRSATMRRIMANALREIGCDEILNSSETGHALEMCDESTDLVITEWGQPGDEGIDLVKQIRANQASSQTRILMVSARDSREDVLEAVQAGVNSYILKPFTAETLKLKLGQLLGADEAGTEEPADASTLDPTQEAPSGSGTDSTE